MNSFQIWARDYARAFGFDVTMTANWVTLHKDGASVECMSAKKVQLCCCSHAARLNVYSLVVDNDGGTTTQLFTTAKERDTRALMIVAEEWSRLKKPEPIPADWREAYDALDGAEFWFCATDHELPLPRVFA